MEVQMTKGPERNDAVIARDRCIEALAGSSDPETRASLWRAALKFNRRAREGQENPARAAEDAQASWKDRSLGHWG
jgi:hypothetical protein